MAARGLSLRFLTKVEVKFSPFDRNCVSTREFLRVITSGTLLKTNDKIQISTDILAKGKEPTINLTWMDKSTTAFVPTGKTAAQMLSEIEGRSRQLALEAISGGKR
eukprot:CFRG6308T1